MNIIGETHSLCPQCLEKIPAKKIVEDDKVYLEKSCAQHGNYRTLIWRGAKHYIDLYKFSTPKTKPNSTIEPRLGCPYDCGLCSEHKQHTCIVVMEITNRCNLNCPVCFARANESFVYEPNLDEIHNMYNTVARHCDKPICVQLSGGEPTVRKDLPKIVALGKKLGIDHIEVNTNGIRSAKSIEYLQELKRAGVDVLYLSFDGLTSDVYIKKCGLDLLDLKIRAIENCLKVGMGVILVPVLMRDVNFDQIGDLIRFAKAHVPIVRGIQFQPISYFGRYPNIPSDEERVTTADVLQAIEEQTYGEIKVENFTPTSCPNVHCDIRCLSVLMSDGKLLPLTYYSSGPSGSVKDVAESVRKAICDLWRSPEDIEVQGKEVEALASCCLPGTWNELVERAERYYLTVSVKPFQDVWNIELERIKECCVHAVTPDGRLIPFCAFNVSDIHGRTLYRQDIFSKFSHRVKGVEVWETRQLL